MRAGWIFLGIAACTPVGPSTANFVCTDCERRDILPAQPLAVLASWSATCRDHVSELLSKKENAHYTTSCHSDEVDVGVRCNAPCSIERASDGTLTVSADAVGAFSFDVELRNRRTGEISRQRSPEMTIRAPDAVGLECELLERGGFELCGMHAIEAGRSRRFAVVAEVNGERRRVRRARLNGHDLGAARADGTFAWHDVVPEETDGAALGRGRHHFEVDAVGAHGVLDLEVR